DGLDVIGEAAARWGAQAVTVCLPYRRDWRGRTVIRVGGGGTKLKLGLHELLSQLGPAGAGEILLYSIDADGTWSGFDLEELHRASQTADLPLVACGGAGRIEDLASAVREGNASAVAAGSMFVYQAKGKGVLISYPDRSRLAEALRPKGEY
ncbi:HisA/HisF-related TIM barrel protein, partial [bacterium]|nr:HisA/HisF-related TIM barrel protein [bacterium]